MPGVIGVMTAKDVKGTNRLKYFVPDRPILCDTKVRFIGDPVAAVLAETREQAVAAVRAVKVEYELLPVMMTPEEALAEGAPQIDPDRPNLCFTQPQIRGDAEAALAKSAAVVETDFSTQTNHQAPLEPEACLAYLEEEEGDGDFPTLVVIGRSINIHYHMGMLQDAVGYENMRYQEAYSGGQFGIKIDVTSEGLAAAAALHFKRPVRYIPSLMESMWLTSKRHAFNMKVRLGADAQGKLTAYCHRFYCQQRSLLFQWDGYRQSGFVDALRILLYPRHQSDEPAGLYQHHLGSSRAGRRTASSQLCPGVSHGYVGREDGD